MSPSGFSNNITRQLSEAERLMIEQKFTEAFDLIEIISGSLTGIRKGGNEVNDDFLPDSQKRLRLMKSRLIKEMARKL